MGEMVRVADVAEIPAGTGKEITLGERVIAVFNVDGSFHAIDGICRHAGGPLGQGPLSGTVVTCPWHGWQFDVKTGQSQINQSIHQPCFEVRVDGADILVRIDEASS